MKQSLQSILNYLDALSLRERILFSFVIASVIYAAWDGLIQSEFEQDHKRLKNLQQQLTQQQQEMDAKLAVDTALLEVKNRTREEVKQTVNKAREKLEQTQAELDAAFESLVPPNKITELLRNLLLQTNGLSLVSLTNEPSKNITPTVENTDDKKGVTEMAISTSLYEHAATIKLSGNYQQLHQYVLALENLKWRLFWDELEYKVTEYPLAEITLRVHTISTDEHWIGM